jgi:hypothetical protein
MIPTRLKQLAARYLAAGLAAVATLVLGRELDASQTTSIGELAGGMVSALAAVGLFLFDLLIHRAETGSILAKPGETKSQVGRSLALLLGGGALLALTLGNVGCSGAGVMRAAEYDGVATRVLDYTDDRAATDPNLDEAQRREVLLDSALLRRGFDAGMNRPPRETEFERRYPVAPVAPSFPAPAPDG